MTGHIDPGELQDFGEGLLSPEEEERVRFSYRGLPSMPGGAGGLFPWFARGWVRCLWKPTPARDLWPQISWRIGRAPEAEPDWDRQGEGPRGGVFRGPTSGPGKEWGKTARIIRLPAWQLMAASVTIALVSGASVWGILSNRTSQPLRDTGVRYQLCGPDGRVR